MDENKTQLIQTGFTLDRLHQDGKLDDEAYTILTDRNKQAIRMLSPMKKEAQECLDALSHWDKNEFKNALNDGHTLDGMRPMVLTKKLLNQIVGVRTEHQIINP